MGRGRQKAKQQKIARKLKYLTTDTDYAQLAKELRSQESPDDVATAGDGHQAAEGVSDQDQDHIEQDRVASHQTVAQHIPAEPAKQAVKGDDDLDEYARWAAEAAAKATSGELPLVQPQQPIKGGRAAGRKPIPMPVPSALKPKKS